MNAPTDIDYGDVQPTFFSSFFRPICALFVLLFLMAKALDFAASPLKKKSLPVKANAEIRKPTEPRGLHHKATR
jgi:hypothetical protein